MTLFPGCLSHPRRDGVRTNLPILLNIESNFILVEVKNTNSDPMNPHVDQLNGRMSERTGQFGLLICQEVQDASSVITRCRTYLNNHYLKVLSKKELIELLQYSMDRNLDEINDFMDSKLRRLLFNPDD
jgi:hypothetical protein